MDTRNSKILGWSVFALTLLAYIPLGLGSWNKPAEFNMPSFLAWVLLAGQFLFATHSQGFDGWRMPFGYFIGNIGVVIVMLYRGGYTMNLTFTEHILFGGTILVGTIWFICYQRSKKSNPRILYFGNILVDMISFYPQIKQFAGVHDPVSLKTLLGWAMFLLIAVINVFVVERFMKKIAMKDREYEFAFNRKKRVMSILEESLFSIEQSIFIGGLLVLMLF